MQHLRDAASAWVRSWYGPPKDFDYTEYLEEHSASTGSEIAEVRVTTVGGTGCEPEAVTVPAAACPGAVASWLVDSGSCYHLLGKDDVPDGQRLTLLREPVRITTANGEVVHDQRTSTPVPALGRSISNVVAGDCPPVTSLGRFCVDDAMDFIWVHT